jgi:two-component system cell cycle response regulator DivK
MWIAVPLPVSTRKTVAVPAPRSGYVQFVDAELIGRLVLQLGAGGAGRSTAFSMAQAGAAVLGISNRTRAKAVDLAKAHHPDLILMDMMMPVVSGYEAVTELKADAGTRDIVIVGLSAKAMATDMERASDVGIDGYITKPFRIAQVLSVVASYLQG